MNWTNYDRLVAHLRGMDAREFDYGNAYVGDGNKPCCVACQVAFLKTGHLRTGELYFIQEFLECTADEAFYLFGGSVGHIDPTSFSTDLDDAYQQVRGLVAERGICSALQRLNVVAARYPARPDEATPVPAFVPDDAAFLASVRALVGRPLVEVEG